MDTLIGTTLGGLTIRYSTENGFYATGVALPGGFYSHAHTTEEFKEKLKERLEKKKLTKYDYARF